ncbi:MAG TPA: VIT1/CCC1 transporter family protein [Chitinophagaceae bacterium]|nr:VIT1/CCC1 transporter family protein [Chitinophagaceae bacterium]
MTEATKNISTPGKKKLLLNTMDRVSEILFGLIMALTFTCSIGIANKAETEIRQLLIAAISCNLAWGLVDAIMFLVGVIAQRSRTRTILESIRNNPDPRKARKYISDTLPPVVASVTGEEELEKMRKNLIGLPGSDLVVRLTTRDFRKALVIFSLVFTSTFPVVIPFIFISNTQLALRISNLIAIVLMFLCGWALAGYVGYNKWIMSIGMTIIGIVLVFVTIALGG